MEVRERRTTSAVVSASKPLLLMRDSAALQDAFLRVAAALLAGSFTACAVSTTARF